MTNVFTGQGDSELPDGWSFVTLGNLLTQRFRKVRVAADGVYERLGVRWYAAGPFKKDAVSGKEIKSQNLWEVKQGDFIYNRLFAWKGSFGVVPPDLHGCLVSNEFPVFEVDTARAEPDFLWRWFSQPDVWEMIEDKSTGSTRTSRLRFKEDDLLRIEVPLPPIIEQQTITSALRTLQQAKDATGRVVVAMRQLKQSLMRHLFTYGAVATDQAGRTELTEMDGGYLPRHWRISNLGTVADLSTGTTPSTARADYYHGSVPFIKTGEIANNRIVEARQHVSEQAVQDYNLKLYRPGTVFMAMYGQGKTRGQVALLEVTAATTQNTAAIVPGPDLNPEFLWLYLMSQYEVLRSKGLHGQISHLNLGFAREIKVPLPPKHEQQEVAESLSSVQAKLEVEEQRLAALDTLFKSLLHHLMTGQVRLPEFVAEREV